MRHLSSLVASSIVLAGVVSAQAIDHPVRYVTRSLDSGYLDNAGATATVVFRGEVRVTGALNMAIYFDRTNLPSGSRLRLTSMHDGAIELFNSNTLAEYQNYSSWFNGDAVQVELIAGPHTTANRVMVVKAAAGEAFIASPTTICGPTDDRQLSSDPRVARQYTTGCTTWLIDKHTVVTAGHCTSNTAQQAHFNVPLSNGSTLVLPPPQDQYRYDTSAVQRLNNGIGQDWTVASTLRNATTGLYAGQAQGAHFQLATPPAFGGGQRIRITGHGTSSVVNRTQVQQTHVGDRVNVSQANALGYTADTTGGNSGSPVINEANDTAIGIHTHGGCTSTGGNNYGTANNRADWAAAVAQITALKSPGCYELFGAGCGAGAAPRLANDGFPDLGRTLRIEVTGAPAAAPVAVVFGTRLATPLSLAFLMMPGCNLYTSVDFAPVVAADGTGKATLVVPVPNVQGLMGAQFTNQGAVVNAAANAAGIAMTNAGEATVGQ